MFPTEIDIKSKKKLPMAKTKNEESCPDIIVSTKNIEQGIKSLRQLLTNDTYDR